MLTLISLVANISSRHVQDENNAEEDQEILFENKRWIKIQKLIAFIRGQKRHLLFY